MYNVVAKINVIYFYTTTVVDLAKTFRLRFCLFIYCFFNKKHRKFISSQRYIKLYGISKDKRFLVKIYFKLWSKCQF